MIATPNELHPRAELSWKRIARPSLRMVVTDIYRLDGSGNSYNSDSVLHKKATVSYRHQGNKGANFLFADAHAQALSISEVPEENGVDTSPLPGDYFWGKGWGKQTVVSRIAQCSRKPLCADCNDLELQKS
eukprot:TRINITY_DN50929_c0_g1_i1.p4 TRINITY_DN50929_c0_g1~~TRINITY_DN50929_c0_g1_i1.p4  ORF type:complete len:131 (-),score=17.08 TRINITY_DN50929_c0_g1_i1:349-741(-)